jgi:hypothetical protein
MTAANSLNISETGFQSFDGINLFKGRTLTAGAGATISNGSGVSGNPTLALISPVSTALGGTGLTSPGANGNVLTSNGSIWTSSPASGGGSSAYFQAYLSASTTNYPASNNTSNVVIFDTTVVNVGSGYNTSTGIFTAPSTGFYSFSCTLFFVTAVGTTQFLMAVTGSVQSFRAAQLTVASAINSFAWTMQMTAGDTVKVQPLADGTGNFQLNGGAISASAFTPASIFSGFKVA